MTAGTSLENRSIFSRSASRTESRSSTSGGSDGGASGPQHDEWPMSSVWRAANASPSRSQNSAANARAFAAASGAEMMSVPLAFQPSKYETLTLRLPGAGRPLEVAAVVGDDLMERLGELQSAGVSLDNMDDGAPFAPIRERVSSANAYYGAWPVVEALRTGAQIVVTGRCTDTGITLAPMIHAFGWAPDDWDRLAAGIVAGHIVECGAQSTGGNFTDWRRVPHYESIGYPVLEVSPDGSFVVTKHAGTGGAVTVRTVKEQLVYEMGDPRSYITPDVVADFGTLRLEQVGRNRVRVWGVRGRPAPSSLKVS